MIRNSGKASAISGKWQGAGTILVVDDEKMVRDIVKQALSVHGFDMVEAADGKEGLAVFSQNPDDIVMVLLDMTMPRMGGEETFSEMRKIKPDVRVILSSGYNEQETTSHFAGKGLAGFIQKPYRPRELTEQVHALLGEKKSS